MEAYHKIENEGVKVKLGDDFNNLNNSIVSNSTRYSLLDSTAKKSIYASPSKR